MSAQLSPEFLVRMSCDAGRWRLGEPPWTNDIALIAASGGDGQNNIMALCDRQAHRPSGCWGRCRGVEVLVAAWFGPKPEAVA
jgi:hypothetical protein